MGLRVSCSRITFRVQGSGCRVEGFGFRAQGSGWQVEGLESRVRVQSIGFLVSGSDLGI